MPFWQSNAFWGITGLIGGGILSFICSLFFHRRQTLLYSITSTELISDDMSHIPGLSIAFGGKNIENLVSSTIRFQNVGNQNIVPSDLAPTMPLRITTDDKFFRTSNPPMVISSHKPANIRAHFDGQAIMFEFDYIKKKQEFSLTLLHSGSISVSGELQDGKIKATDLTVHSLRRSSHALASWLPATFIPLILCAFVTLFFETPIPAPSIYLLALIISFTAFALIFLHFWENN